MEPILSSWNVWVLWTIRSAGRDPLLDERAGSLLQGTQ